MSCHVMTSCLWSSCN